MRSAVIIVALLLCASCGEKNNQPAQTGGQEKYENISCKDFTKEFNHAFVNVIKNQPDSIFKQPNNTTFTIKYIEDECFDVTKEYSTLNVNVNDNSAIYVTKTTKLKIQSCEMSGEGVEVESEIDNYNLKDKLVKAVESSKEVLKIETDRPCSVTLDSNKDEFNFKIYIDNSLVNEVHWDFKDIKHPAEIGHRMNQESYTRKQSSAVLSTLELESKVNNCLQRTNLEDKCQSTDRTLEDWLGL